MLELVVTSSILILVVVSLRFIFGNKISRRFRYAMWSIVLLRLLIPVQIFSSPISVLNVVSDDIPSFIQAERTVTPSVNDYNQVLSNPVVPSNPESNYFLTDDEQQTMSRIHIERTELSLLTTQNLLLLFWVIGAFTIAGWFLITNLRLYRELRTYRQPIKIKGSRLPVYYVDELLSPCLFGLFKPAIYLTPKSMESQNSIDHVMTHELTHYIQKDHIWAVLRGICLSIYWFNPLVWVAAWLSRNDCELSCDEAAVIGMGEDIRIDYGRTLVSMISTKGKPDTMLCTATMMSSGAIKIKKRLEMIINNKKSVISALLVTILLLTVAACATFTSALNTDEDMQNETDAPVIDDSFGNDYSDGELLENIEPIDIDIENIIANMAGFWRMDYPNPINAGIMIIYDDGSWVSPGPLTTDLIMGGSFVIVTDKDYELSVWNSAINDDDLSSDFFYLLFTIEYEQPQSDWFEFGREMDGYVYDIKNDRFGQWLGSGEGSSINWFIRELTPGDSIDRSALNDNFHKEFYTITEDGRLVFHEDIWEEYNLHRYKIYDKLPGYWYFDGDEYGFTLYDGFTFYQEEWSGSKHFKPKVPAAQLDHGSLSGLIFTYIISEDIYGVSFVITDDKSLHESIYGEIPDEYKFTYNYATDELVLIGTDINRQLQRTPVH